MEDLLPKPQIVGEVVLVDLLLKDFCDLEGFLFVGLSVSVRGFFVGDTDSSGVLGDDVTGALLGLFDFGMGSPLDFGGFSFGFSFSALGFLKFLLALALDNVCFSALEPGVFLSLACLPALDNVFSGSVIKVTVSEVGAGLLSSISIACVLTVGSTIDDLVSTLLEEVGEEALADLVVLEDFASTSLALLDLANVVDRILSFFR